MLCYSNWSCLKNRCYQFIVYTKLSFVMENTKEFLPIGTVITIYGLEQKVMIYGRKQQQSNEKKFGIMLVAFTLMVTFQKIIMFFLIIYKLKKFYLLDMRMKKNFPYEKNSYEFLKRMQRCILFNLSSVRKM